MKNQYEIVGDTVLIYLKYKGDVVAKTIIDKEDFDLVNSHPGTFRPYPDRCTKSYYALGNVYREGKGHVFRLHRFIMDAEPGFDVDHINHDTLDNRRSNLRTLRHFENLQNRKGATRASKSGIRGVCWVTREKIWKVQVYKKGKRVHNSTHKDLKEAEQKAIEMRAKLLDYAQ